MQQAEDFRTESDALAAAVSDVPDAAWSEPTLFKGWTLNDVFIHLHLWNRMADLSVTAPDRFEDRLAEIMGSVADNGYRATENRLIAKRGMALFDLWQIQYTDMARRWASLDPKRRVKWAGPDMSVRSSITARQMETWAHGQAVFDLLGLDRQETDRIRNVVVLGINTYDWTFRVRGRALPGPMPHLVLQAPSGEVWSFGEAQNDNRIEGSAVDFARVVAQTRNVADTGLRVTGAVAADWMANAQCFAGGPEQPPPPGTRLRQTA